METITVRCRDDNHRRTTVWDPRITDPALVWRWGPSRTRGNPDASRANLHGELRLRMPGAAWIEC